VYIYIYIYIYMQIHVAEDNIYICMQHNTCIHTQTNQHTNKQIHVYPVLQEHISLSAHMPELSGSIHGEDAEDETCANPQSSEEHVSANTRSRAKVRDTRSHSRRQSPVRLSKNLRPAQSIEECGSRALEGRGGATPRQCDALELQQQAGSLPHACGEHVSSALAGSSGANMQRTTVEQVREANTMTEPCCDNENTVLGCVHGDAERKRRAAVVYARAQRYVL
jgi:hypothetical protein